MSEQLVFVVDDDAAVRDSLVLLLASAGLKAMAFESAAAFLDVVKRVDFESACVLLDMRMPDMNGLECQERMNADGIHLPVIFLTAHADVPSAVRAMRQGAIDYLEKPVTDVQLLLDRSNEALRGNIEKRRQKRHCMAAMEKLALLTAREREIVEHIRAGKPNKVIAGDLAISERTVEVHRSRAFHKLGLHHVAELVALLDAGERAR